jgi:hypothetical protein
MFLGEPGDVLGQQADFVQHQSKLGGSAFIQMMSLGSLENGKNSLNGFSQVAADLGLEISASGIHQRLSAEAVALLSEVCHIWMQASSSQPLKGLLKNFGAVRVIDSSYISLADALAEYFCGHRNPASMKAHLSFDYRSERIEVIQIQAGREPDQNSDLPQELSLEGDFVLFDLGYFAQDRFAQFIRLGFFHHQCP